MNWRALVWRLATWLAGPQPVNLNVRVRTRVTVHDVLVRDDVERITYGAV